MAAENTLGKPSGSAEHCVLRTIIWMGLILDFKVEKKINYM